MNVGTRRGDIVSYHNINIIYSLEIAVGRLQLFTENKKIELMLTRRAKAYSSSGSR